MRRLLLVLVTTALVASGCGMLTDPSVGSADEVFTALEALRDGARGRLTASLEVDEGELRRVLAADGEARAFFRGLVDDSELEDTDALLAGIEEVRTALADHAVLVEFGDDHSGRFAAEHRGQVWADLRVRQLPLDAEDPAAGISLDLQAQVDWEAAATALERPDLPEEVDDAARGAEEFLAEMTGAELPDLAGVRELVLGFLAGDLVAVGGEITPELTGLLGGAGGFGPGMLGPGMLGLEPAEAGALGGVPLDLDPDEFARTAVSFSDYRREGGMTLVDVTLEVRAAASALLDALEDDPTVLGMTTEDLQEARASLDEVPERLRDVAVLRFDDGGTVAGLRIDVLDTVLQVAREVDADDEDLALLERVAGDLDATGFFVDLALADVGAVETVLTGDPAVRVDVEELAELAGTLFLGGLAGGSMFDDATLPLEPVEPLDGSTDDLEELFGTMPFHTIDPAQLAVGDCFDDDLFFDASATTVDCTQPHTNEAIGTITFASFEEALAAVGAAEACSDAFTAYVGTPYDESELFVDVVTPLPEAFADGPADGMCYATAFEQVTGSFADSER